VTGADLVILVRVISSGAHRPHPVDGSGPWSHTRLSTMVGRLVVACLLIAAPVLAQSPVYTNADLGKARTWTRTASAEELASLAKRQFVAPPAFPDGPTVLTIAGDPSHGLFGPLELTPAQPLDPDWQGHTGWYGPGFAGGGWFGGGGLSGGRGRIDAGPRGRGHAEPQTAKRVVPRSPTPRPPSPPNAQRPGRQASAPGTGGGITIHVPGR
jgi:uncharacterized membrane protein YgcG